MTSTSVFSQASSMQDPTRYIPGYFALSSSIFTRPIELHWFLDGNTKPIRPLPPTSDAHPENRPSTTTATTPLFQSVPTTSQVSSDPESSADNPNSTYLVEHADRAEIHRRQKRVESELSEALQGDIEWVRSGGILRDTNGRRDFGRTRRIREQLDERERERASLAAWTEYEDRWRAGLSVGGGCGENSSSSLSEGANGDEGIGFGDVAWPVAKPPEDPDGLTVGAVREFVLSPLRGKNITPSKKRDRVRQLLLRYHPDKTAFLLSRVADEEKDRVREGINTVFMGLKSLQEDPELQGLK